MTFLICRRVQFVVILKLFFLCIYVHVLIDWIVLPYFCDMPPKRSPQGKCTHKMRQTRLVDQSQAEFFVTPPNANVRNMPLQLEAGAKVLIEMSTRTTGKIVVCFEKGECSKFISRECA